MKTKDIFISYKNDGESNNFAARLYATLNALNYDVYFNSNERHSGSFPERLKDAINGCKDFILILSTGCMEQLKRHDEIDWIREELLAAKNANKNIIPVLLSGVAMPKNKRDMPEDLQFLPDLDALYLPEQYMHRPIDKLIGQFESFPEKDLIYRDQYNSNNSFNITEEMQMMVRQADDGDEDSMYAVANMYYFGVGDEAGTSNIDYKKAYKWFKKVIEKDGKYKSYAEKMIGHMYYSGIVPGERQSYEKCLDMQLKACENPEISPGHVAFMYSIGSGCEFDFETAEKYYKKIISDSSDYSIKYSLATFYKSYGLFEKAAEIYKELYSTNPQASYELGMLYKKGVLSDPPKPDFFRAAFYLMNAISFGNCPSEAYYDLGHMYFNPTGGFPKDFVKAQEYFLQAAERGNIEGQYILGYMYFYGYVERSYLKARKYLEAAVKQGHRQALLQLSMVYQQDECRNYHLANRYAKMCADSGNATGCYLYANMLFMGRGCPPNIEKAYEYYRRAKSLKCDQADYMLNKVITYMDNI